MLIKIVSDANIPFVEEMFSSFGVLDLIPGHEITPSTLIDVDALIVRSVTFVDESLLAGSAVRFVGSATAGIDHIDYEFLNQRGIGWAHAPGCNAESVVEWVLAALFYLSQLNGTPVLESTLGIVGCGEIGSRLAKRATALGLHVLANDPPRARLAAEEDERSQFVSLNTLLEQSDIVSLHVPWLADGPDATENLIGGSELERMKNGAWVLNTSRGGVVDEAALIDSIREGKVGASAVDVWNGEPRPNQNLQDLVDICSPHIAGYSRDAKRNCIQMIADRVASFFSTPGWKTDREASIPIRLKMPETDPRTSPETFIHRIVEQMYRIEDDVVRMRLLPVHDSRARETAFRRQRWEYPPRHTFARYQLSSAGLTEEWQVRLEEGLQIELVD
ncbi:MAG: 4-phosphoerythronate dehydrogenase [Rhodothermia bacterium]|nr:MAG: 4-phosphoerythronate dehydrogenase [Rhodothermia bacterium]